MDIGLNNHLIQISSELFIKNGSIERFNIERSLGIIIDKLEEYFDDQVSDVIVFGSYTRDTILPRVFDSNSDIDILVEFNTDNYDKLKPESYRSQLKKFAESKYSKALVAKDHPSIVIELNHIKFDLVPSIFDKGFFYDSIEIPDKDGGWMETEPDKISGKVTEANKQYNSIVKPIIRLLKYWNASCGYPYGSYELEVLIADMNFDGDNYERGFLHAAQNLPASGFPLWAKDAVGYLKSTAKEIKEHLKYKELNQAKAHLSKLLPHF